MCAAVRQWKQRRWSNTNASTSGKTTGSIFTTALGSEKKQKLVVGEERRRGGRRRRTISGAVKASGEERQHRLHTGKKKKGTRAGIVCCGVNGANTAGSAPDSSHGSAHEDEEERASRRVVVTGMGVVSSLGHDPETMYASMLQGTSGISMIEKFDASELPTRFAGEVKDFESVLADGKYIQKKEARRLDEYMKYILYAGKKALEDAGLGFDGGGRGEG